MQASLARCHVIQAVASFPAAMQADFAAMQRSPAQCKRIYRNVDFSGEK
jgi:hypothetical protein